MVAFGTKLLTAWLWVKFLCEHRSLLTYGKLILTAPCPRGTPHIAIMPPLQHIVLLLFIFPSSLLDCELFEARCFFLIFILFNLCRPSNQHKWSIGKKLSYPCCVYVVFKNNQRKSSLKLQTKLLFLGEISNIFGRYSPYQASEEIRTQVEFFCSQSCLNLGRF